MNNFKYIRALAIGLALVSLTISNGATQKAIRPSELAINEATLSQTLSAPDSLSTTSTFYTVRRDLRRCAAPMCGGYFVKRVNLPMTRCADGRNRVECYVTEINWNSQTEIELPRALLRGDLSGRADRRFTRLGVFRVTESWQALNSALPAGAFYRVRDTGLRCITFPCPTHHETKLNSIASAEIAGVDVSGVGGFGKVSMTMNSPEGVIVSGDHVNVQGPGGRRLQLKATQIYLRITGGAAGLKPCIKTGCSNQVCSDQPAITTCEWRAEYACYQKASCERQQDGNCGFTRTRDLNECLARK